MSRILSKIHCKIFGHKFGYGRIVNANHPLEGEVRYFCIKCGKTYNQ